MITAYMLASRDNILFVFKPTDLCICLLCILFFSLAPAQQCKAVSNQNSSLSQDLESDQLPSAEVLWNQARESLDRGDIEKAADTFLCLYRHYPDAPMAEESLWRAAVYYRDVASASRNPDWEAVRLLFKMYAADFSESPRVGEAYFEMGIAQFHKRFYREALTRFKLFLKRFPDSPLASKARYFQAKCLVETGQLQEAKKIFEEFVHNDDTETRAKGLAGVAEVLSAQGKYLESLPYFRKSMALSNTFYLQFPEIEILRVLGETYLHLNNEEYGRKHLLHYLNIAGGALDRAKVLSQLAESYMREGNSAVAQRMYDKVIEEGRPGDSAVVLAKFRKAQFLDDPHSTLTKWQKKGDLLDPSEDAPYLNLLDIMYKGDVAQEARWGLFVRYRARDDFAKAELTGRHYLQYAPSDTDAKEIRQKVDAILLYITEKLIDKKDYQAVYDLYLEEHPHVVKFSTGRLLYLVGRALEELYLFDQAAVVYYRAVKLPLSEADKIDLYYRRAHVYLVIGDLNSADILLKYIRPS